MLANEPVHVGAWRDDRTGAYYLDLSELVTNRAAAGHRLLDDYGTQFKPERAITRRQRDPQLGGGPSILELIPDKPPKKAMAGGAEPAAP